MSVGKRFAAQPMARHQDNFAALRMFAAVLVIFGHSYPLTGSVAPGFLGNAVHTIALKIFFVISGYLITESWMRDRSLIRYFTKRVLRIIPGLVVLILITAFVVGPIITNLSFVDYFNSRSLYNYFSNVFLYPRYNLPGVFDGNPYPVAVNGSLWTLPVEFLMYILVPFLFKGRIGKYIVLLSLVIVTFFSVLFFIYKISPVVIYGTNLINALELAPYFLAGAAYRVWDGRRFLNLQVALAILLIAPLAVQGRVSAEILLLIVLPYSVLAFGFSSPPVFRGLDRFGDISYGVYLYAFLVQQIFCQYLDLAGRPGINFLLSVTVVIPLGWLSWHYVESPALKLKPRKSRKPEPLAASNIVV
ncbi:acyltransferase [Martelella sp. FLE1502]